MCERREDTSADKIRCLSQIFHDLSSTASQNRTSNIINYVVLYSTVRPHNPEGAFVQTWTHRKQECRLCGHDKEDSVHTVCHCPVLACKRSGSGAACF